MLIIRFNPLIRPFLEGSFRIFERREVLFVKICKQLFLLAHYAYILLLLERVLHGLTGEHVGCHDAAVTRPQPPTHAGLERILPCPRRCGVHASPARASL